MKLQYVLKWSHQDLKKCCANTIAMNKPRLILKIPDLLLPTLNIYQKMRPCTYHRIYFCIQKKNYSKLVVALGTDCGGLCQSSKTLLKHQKLKMGPDFCKNEKKG